MKLENINLRNIKIHCDAAMTKPRSSISLDNLSNKKTKHTMDITLHGKTHTSSHGIVLMHLMNTLLLFAQIIDKHAIILSLTVPF